MATTVGLLLDPVILTEDEVLKLYHRAYHLLMEGKSVMTFEGEGTSFTYKYPIPVETMLAEARYCLKQINPSKYGHISTHIRPFFV